MGIIICKLKVLFIILYILCILIIIPNKFLLSFKNEYISKKVNMVHTIWYNCSQSSLLKKKPRKHENSENHRDRECMDRFNCEGRAKISINIDTCVAKVHLKHNILHKRPEWFGVTESIKEHIKKNSNLTPSDIFKQLEYNNPNLTQKQVHSWWAYYIKKEYVRDNNDQLQSAQMLLQEYNYELLLINTKNGIRYFGFVTPFFKILCNNKEIIVDATCKYIFIYFF